MGSPTVVQIGRPNLSDPLPDFCQTACDPQLAIGRDRNARCDRQADDARLAIHREPVLPLRDGPLRIHDDHFAAAERSHGTVERRPVTAPARDGDLSRASERSPHDRDPEELLLREETRPAAGAHDGITVGQGIEIGDVVARDDRRARRAGSGPGARGRAGTRTGAAEGTPPSRRDTRVPWSAPSGSEP